MDSHRRRPKWPLLALALAVTALAFPVACGNGDGSLPGIGGGGTTNNPDGAVTCTDQDGDGYGDGCSLGADCNDSDPTITNQCYICDKPHTGSGCSVEGSRASCGQVESKVGSQVTCGYGEMVCSGGKWGECIINNSVTLLPGGDPKQHTAGLGAPGSCAANPCDPYCVTWPDTPAGLTPDGGGVVVTDAGITLPGAEGGGVGTGSCTGGTSGACSHSVCEPGTKLSAGCDTSGAGTSCVAKNASCAGGGACCYGLTCQSGVCKEPPGGDVAIFNETFSSASGWSTGGEWEIGPAVGYTGWSSNDPSTDTTPGSDNKLAGTNIGGRYSDNSNYSLVSPTIDTTGTGALTLTLQSWEDFESGYDHGYIDVSTNNGGSWSNIYATSHYGGGWNSLSFDISSYRSTQFKLRFHFTSDYSVHYGGWSVDDIQITTYVASTTCHATGGSCSSGQSCCSDTSCVSGKCTTPAPPSCVQAVCAAIPSCCTSQWDTNCVNAIPTYCAGASCNADAAGKCVYCACDSIDHDGDGYSCAQGDCKDCDPTVNPGAFDFPGDGIDNDCNGTVDDGKVTCDTGLPFNTSDPTNYAKGMDLCKFTTAGATGAAKTWGVISAALTRADGSSCSDTLQRAVTTQFGSGNFPKVGSAMTVFSSGTARDANDPGYVNPSGQYASYDAGTHVTPPAGFPRNAAGCPNGSAANDSCGLTLQIRAPTNAKSFSYNFEFFSSEYPEWVCTAYNDSFVALYDGALNPFADKNISFDSNNNPVSVNVGFFNIPGNPTTTTHPLLNGTGFDGSCWNYGYWGVCGGSTGWLVTTAPVNPGETITMRYMIWDTGDHYWDSTVLLDGFQWSPKTSTISTQPTLPPPPPPTLSEGSFTRDYDASTACPAGTIPVWGSWSWTATTPNDSQIQFFVKTADTLAGLASAPEDQLQFTNPPGPASLTGTQATAKTTPLDTQNGSAVVDTTLANKNRVRSLHFVRMRARLMPSSDKLTGPTLNAWNLEVSCQPGT